MGDRDSVRTLAARLPRSACGGERTEDRRPRRPAATHRRPHGLSGHGGARDDDGGRRAVGRMRRVETSRHRYAARSAACAGACRALRLPRHRSRLDRDRGGSAAVGRTGTDANVGCRDAHAGTRRPDAAVHAALHRPGRGRRDADRLPRARDEMTSAFASLGLPEIIAGILVLALNAYVLTGGADFGGGVWDLFASGPRRDAQRTLIAKAIGPIWEANHVWLILVVVILFTAFPAAFATLGIILHIPLSLMLIGIVLRGSSFVFRSYGARDDATERRWGRVFAIASLVTPLLLGVIVG